MAVCTDLRGLAENLYFLSCDGRFLLPFRAHLRAQTEAILPVHLVGLELNPSHLPDDAIHVSGFSEEDGDLV
jgi:hypothetical protein